MKKQIILFSLLLLGILGCQKNFLTGDIEALEKDLNRESKIYNAISTEEARSEYEKVLSSIPHPESEDVNPNDLLPLWDAARNYNFADTTDSYLSVTAGVFVGGGYKKLLFMRQNGQLTYFIVYIRGTVEYIHRKNGVAEMSDFCGHVFFKKSQGGYFVGFTLRDGQITEILTPSNDPRPENQEEDDAKILDTFTVTATRPSSSQPTFFYYNGLYSQGSSYINTLLNSTGSSGGGGGSTSNSFNGMIAPVIDSTLRVCPDSFEPRVVSMLRPDGTRLVTNSTLLTAGLRDFAISLTYVDIIGTQRTQTLTIGYLFISMPNNCYDTFGNLASQAISNAITTTQSSLSGQRLKGTDEQAGIFETKLFDALSALDQANCAGHNSPSRSSVMLLSSGAVSAIGDININYNTSFTSYTACR